ncbi:LamG-like jellyroll fold domain-containing protein [Streptomyces sp. NPDC048438]|uniref:LamG-like jellyroll fold domain-containing protein n=1 Tax=Streptomyces sp. NPDC048438 TaxID=3365551 RepID=UPI003720EFA9
MLLQYDEKASQVQLYVDGVLADSAPYAEADAWQADSFLQAGRDSAADGVVAHFLEGDIDEVRTGKGSSPRRRSGRCRRRFRLVQRANQREMPATWSPAR